MVRALRRIYGAFHSRQAPYVNYTSLRATQAWKAVRVLPSNRNKSRSSPVVFSLAVFYMNHGAWDNIGANSHIAGTGQLR